MGVGIDATVWESAFQAFLVHPGKWEWLAKWARSFRSLPVYCDWTHAFGVTADGAVIAHEHEPWPARRSEIESGVVSDQRFINLAFHQGKKLYPWLSAFLPTRPDDAQICSMCGGTGSLPYPMICYCGGAGWVPAIDTWVNTDRFRK